MNEIYHHGIKGMHWGVRRFQNKDGSLTSAGEKRYDVDPNNDADRKEMIRQQIATAEKKERKNTMKKTLMATVATFGVVGGAYLAYKTGAVKSIAKLVKKNTPVDEKSVKNIMSDSLDDIKSVMKEGSDDIFIPKGSSVKRTAFGESAEKFDINNVKHLYTTFEKADAETYKALLKPWNSSGNGVNRQYEINFSAVVDLRAPSVKKANEIFDKLWSNDETYRKALVDEVHKFYTETGSGLSRDTIERMVENDSRAWGSWAIVKQGSKASEMLINKYKSHGYNSVLDYHDINDGITEKPLIVFDAYKNLKVEDISRVYTHQKKRAAQYAKEYGTEQIREALRWM